MTMNPTSDHLEDEILSALLDGDADGEPDAAAHLRACDRCSGRQAELAGARAALAAAPVEPLDELTRRRLVAAALAAAEPASEAGVRAVAPIGRSRWAGRHPALIGSAAAVVLALLVGVPFVVDNGGSGRDQTLTAQAPLQNSADSFLGDLGDLSDRDRLRLRLSGVNESYAVVPPEAGPSPAAGAASPAPLVGAAPGSGGAAGLPNDAVVSTTLAPQTSGRTAGPSQEAGSPAASKAAPGAAADRGFSSNQGFSSDQASRDRADTDACVAALLNGPARGGRLTRAGTGTYRGRPAIVASFELGGGTEAFITDRSGCAVLDRFSL